MAANLPSFSSSIGMAIWSAPFFDDGFEADGFEEFLGIGLDVQDDGGAGFFALSRFQRVDAAAGGFPFPGFGGPDLAGNHLNLVGDHEGGVEADAELADQAGAFLGFGLLGQAGGEGRGAGAGDRAEVLRQLLLAHPRAGIGDGDGVGQFVLGDFDGRIFRQSETFIGKREKAALVNRIRRVGDQLAQENFAVGV